MPAYPRPAHPPSSEPVTPWLAPGAPALPAVPTLWTLPSHPTSARRARRMVAELLPTEHRDHLADDLGLIASELVTNAVRHGPHLVPDQPVELVLWPADGHYWLAVSDHGTELPVLPPPPRPEDTRGRGLLLVEAVAATWGVVPRRFVGKSVVAGVRLRDG